MRHTLEPCVITYIFKTESTVKPVLSRHSKIGKTKVLKTNGSLMQAKVLQNALLEHSAKLNNIGLANQVLVIFLGGRLRQVLLYPHIFRASCCIIKTINEQRTISVLHDETHFMLMCYRFTVHVESYKCVKVFRIILKFRFVRLTFHRKSVSKSGIMQIIIDFMIYFQLTKDNWLFKLKIVDIFIYYVGVRKI